MFIRNKLTLTILAVAITFSCTACRANRKYVEENTDLSAEEIITEESTTEASKQEETPEVDDTKEEAEAEIVSYESEEIEEVSEPSGPWTATGNYVDDQGNYLTMYQTNEIYGDLKDGWGAMLMYGEDTYNGELDENDGKLSGALSIYTSDGSEGAEIQVTLTDMGDYILVQKDNGEEVQFKPDSTYNSEVVDENFLPMFSYNMVFEDEDFDSLEAAAYDYLSFDYSNDYNTDNVMIPYVSIVGIEESDPEDVLLYGDYYVWEFSKEGDKLVTVSGGHCPGIIHLQRFGEGDDASYTATGVFDVAYTDDDAIALFGDHYDQYHEVSSDEDIRDVGLSHVISQYVKANDLNITKFRIAGGEDIELP